MKVTNQGYRVEDIAPGPWVSISVRPDDTVLHGVCIETDDGDNKIVYSLDEWHALAATVDQINRLGWEMANNMKTFGKKKEGQ